MKPNLIKINIKDLSWDQSIYPRGTKSQKTIDAYIESLAIGAQFPPIKTKKVFNYTDADGNKIALATIILDGIHRWSAFKEKGIKEIAAIEWKEKPLNYAKNKTALLLESAKCNTIHGDRLSSNDKKRVARDIASTDPECSYLKRNTPYIPCYAIRKELGLRNSSNIGEKMNGLVVSNRQKHNGMSW